MVFLFEELVFCAFTFICVLTLLEMRHITTNEAHVSIIMLEYKNTCLQTFDSVISRVLFPLPTETSDTEGAPERRSLQLSE